MANRPTHVTYLDKYRAHWDGTTLGVFSDSTGVFVPLVSLGCIEGRGLVLVLEPGTDYSHELDDGTGHVPTMKEAEFDSLGGFY